MKKLLKRILLTVAIVIVILVVGLIINNRVYYIKYSTVDTKKDYLSEKDISRAHEIFQYLNDDGNSIFNGFDGNDMNLLLYNEVYEFLFSDFQPSGLEWTYIGKDEALDRSIYRRKAENSQAFAVKIDSTLVGSFPTKDTYHKQILSEIPIFFPPQLVSADELYYRAIVIHEIAHAFQGKYNSYRLDKAEHLHNVCSTYYTDSKFNSLIEKEGEYLEAAIKASDSTTALENVQAFLDTRAQRRNDFSMTNQQILEEQEMEWLEGLARYAEYKASQGSSSTIAKGLTNISQKVKTTGDDRYYTLGMAEYMVILKLDPAYEKSIINDNVALEDILSKLCEK